ncbi:MAG: putative rane protein [Chthoniobacteraceae bacterium]|nr:putative rane protein [Chthoniobacteraceae bacterium]
MNLNSFSISRVFKLLKATASSWMEDNCLRLGAALAYYSIFSIAPLLVIAISIAGLFFGREAAYGEIQTQMSGYVGHQAAQAIEAMVQSASKPAQSKMAALIGVVTLIIGAGGVFGQLKDSLNTIWEVQQKPGGGIKAFLRERLLSFGMVLVIGFLLLVSLVLTAAIAVLNKYIGTFLPMSGLIATVFAFIIAFLVVTLLFATIFKVLPDATVEWRNVWVGAVVTALFFELGKTGLGWYLGMESTSSAYGAAGSIVLLLLWVYYNSLILFFGAEFTQVYANETGTRIRPSKNAEPVTAEMRAQQGMAPIAASKDPQAKPAEAVKDGTHPIHPPIIVEIPVAVTAKNAGPMRELITATVVGFGVGTILRLLENKRKDPTELIREGVTELAQRGGGVVSNVAESAAKKGRSFIPRNWL